MFELTLRVILAYELAKRWIFSTVQLSVARAESGLMAALHTMRTITYRWLRRIRSRIYKEGAHAE